MAKIRIKQGGYGLEFHDGTVVRHVLKTPESGPFECDDAEAAYLVRRGTAEYVQDAEKPAAAAPIAKAVPSGPHTRRQLEAMEYKDLKILAEKGLGLKLESKKKADIIEAIEEAEDGTMIKDEPDPDDIEDEDPGDFEDDDLGALNDDEEEGPLFSGAADPV